MMKKAGVMMLALAMLWLCFPLTVCAMPGGSCGENAQWTFAAKTGELRISGTGAMTSYSTANDVPWHRYFRSQEDSWGEKSPAIRSVVIEDGITEIGMGAFGYCTEMTSVQIPGSVKTICCCAFEGCRSLESVELPEGVEEIQQCAFDNCSQMKSFSIPASMKRIDFGSFDACKSLTGFTVSADNPLYYTDENGALYNENVLVQYPAGSPKTSYYCPENICIGGSFKGAVNLKNVEIPGAVNVLYEMFKNCKNLESVTLGDSLRSIGERAFYGCENLRQISSLEGVTHIGDSAFYGCKNLKEITIPSGVTQIGESVFFGCTGLTKVTISDGVTQIGKYAFDGCESLTEVSIPDSVTQIRYCAFASCKSLKHIVLPGSLKSISDSVFFSSGLEELPEGLTVITKEMFRDCSGLQDVEIPDGIRKIDRNAFLGCENLRSVTIPASVSEIGDSAFAECASLESVRVDADNPAYCNDAYGALYTKDRTQLLQYPAGAAATKYVVPDGVVKIGSGAFASCAFLTDLTIPEGVTELGDACISGWKKTAKITWPESLQSTPWLLFKDCSAPISIWYAGTKEQWMEFANIDTDNTPRLFVHYLRISEPETEPESEPEADDETLVIRFLWIPIAAAAAVAGVIVAARLHRKKKASANAQAQTQPEQTEDAGTNA